MDYLTESVRFLRQFVAANQTTGAVLPSSPFLARALCAGVSASRRRPAQRVLEVGPGTGAVTRELLSRLRPGDRVDLVELNAEFAALLRQRFREEASFARHASAVRVIESALQELPGSAEYDVVISGLPHNNFSGVTVAEIFAAYRRLARPGALVSYFEYALLRDVKHRFSSGPERARLESVSAVVGEQLRAWQVDVELVVLNVPPAYVRRLRFG